MREGIMTSTGPSRFEATRIGPGKDGGCLMTAVTIGVMLVGTAYVAVIAAAEIYTAIVQGM